MSSVLIKGMKMPKGCIDCPFAERIPPGRTRCLLTCRLLSEGYEAPSTERNWHCTLVELPEKHGSLVDADVLIEELKSCHIPGAPYVDAGISIAIGKVCNASTVIEAEED